MGVKSDDSHVYNPFCDSRSGFSCTVIEANVVSPISVLLIWPLISLPLGLTKIISGTANSVSGFVTVQVMEYRLPATAVPSVDVVSVTTESGTVSNENS